MVTTIYPSHVYNMFTPGPTSLAWGFQMRLVRRGRAVTGRISALLSERQFQLRGHSPGAAVIDSFVP
jgi:hypothetical protein